MAGGRRAVRTASPVRREKSVRGLLTQARSRRRHPGRGDIARGTARTDRSAWPSSSLLPIRGSTHVWFANPRWVSVQIRIEEYRKPSALSTPAARCALRARCALQCLRHRESDALPSSRRRAPRTPGFAESAEGFLRLQAPYDLLSEHYRLHHHQLSLVPRSWNPRPLH